MFRARRPQHSFVLDPAIVVEGRVYDRDVARHEGDLKTVFRLVQQPDGLCALGTGSFQVCTDLESFASRQRQIPVWVIGRRRVFPVVGARRRMSSIGRPGRFGHRGGYRVRLLRYNWRCRFQRNLIVGGRCRCTRFGAPSGFDPLRMGSRLLRALGGQPFRPGS